MADDIPRDNEPVLDTGQEDDVLSKIDQLLNRHRPKAPAAEAVPVLTDAPTDETVSIGDGIPVLMDVVTGPSQPSRISSSASQSSTISGALILQRMEIALDVEHLRLLAQIDRDDTAKARMLDQLVGELKRALPGAIGSAIKNKVASPT